MNVLILLGFLLSAFGLYLPHVGFGSPYRCAISTYHSYIGCTPNIVSDFLIQLQFAATAAAAATDWVVYLLRFFCCLRKNTIENLESNCFAFK